MYIPMGAIVVFALLYVILREQGGPEFLWGVIKFALTVAAVILGAILMYVTLGR